MTHWSHVPALSLIKVQIFVASNIHVLTPVCTNNVVPTISSFCAKIHNILGNLIRKIIIMSDGIKREVCRTIASFLTIHCRFWK